MPTQTKSRQMSTKLFLAQFDQAIAQLREAGYKPATLKDAARERIAQGKYADVSTNGFYVAESVLYIPGKGNYLVPANYSPILASPVEATNAHRNVGDFYVNSERAEQIAENSIAFPSKDIEVPVNRLAGEEVFAKSLGEKLAREYGEFLADAGIESVPIVAVDQYDVNRKKKPFARQAWLRSLDGRSGLDGDGWGLLGGLGYYGRVLGVRRGKTGGASSQKIETYTARQLDTIE